MSTPTKQSAKYLRLTMESYPLLVAAIAEQPKLAGELKRLLEAVVKGRKRLGIE